MQSSMKKYGVALTEDQAKSIERLLDEGDSRSKRIRNLLALGLVAEGVMLENNWFPPSLTQRERVVKDAMEKYFDEEMG